MCRDGVKEKEVQLELHLTRDVKDKRKDLCGIISCKRNSREKEGIKMHPLCQTLWGDDFQQREGNKTAAGK